MKQEVYWKINRVLNVKLKNAYDLQCKTQEIKKIYIKCITNIFKRDMLHKVINNRQEEVF